MRILILISLTVLIVTSCNNKQNNQQTSDNNLAVELSKIEVTIDGMTSNGCEKTIKSSVNKLPGIHSVSASYVDSNAIIEYNVEQVSISEIKDAINKTGYKVVDLAIK